MRSPGLRPDAAFQIFGRLSLESHLDEMNVLVLADEMNCMLDTAVQCFAVDSADSF